MYWSAQLKDYGNLMYSIYFDLVLQKLQDPA